MNRELFKKIHDIISVSPAEFDMDSWEDDAACGTTRCIAGWAIHLTTGAPLHKRYQVDHHPSVVRLAADFGVPDDFELLAAKLLDLPQRLRGVFYTSNEVGAEFVKRAAEGATAEELLTWLNWGISR